MFYLPLPTNIYVSCHLRSEEVSLCHLVGVCAAVDNRVLRKIK